MNRGKFWTLWVSLSSFLEIEYPLNLRWQQRKPSLCYSEGVRLWACGKKRGQGVADVDVDTKFDSPEFNELVEVSTAAGKIYPVGQVK